MWEKEYKKRGFYWGLKPDNNLKEILEYAKKGTAFDIGADEGKNAIFLAKNGFKVEAIDKIKEGLEKCKRIAEKNNLLIKTKVSDIINFNFKKSKYSLIIAINSLDFLRVSEIKKILRKIHHALLPEGIFYLVVLSTKDPAFKKCEEKKLRLIEKNTFYLSKFKTFRHFFTKTELLNLFKSFKIIKINEEVKKDNYGKPHIHHLIRIIAKKIK